MNNQNNVVSQEDFLKFFNLEDKGIKEFNVYHKDDGIHVFVMLEKKPCKCPVCLNYTSQVKDYTVKKINHSILNNTACTIDYKARRYKCRTCNKTFYEQNPFTTGSSKLSLVTVYNILEELRRPTATYREVAKRYHVSQTTVANIFDNHVDISRKRLPEVICIDEVYAFKSSHGKYVCALMDFKTHEIIDVLPSRKKQYLSTYFSGIPKEEREQVKIVSCDMWETYRLITKTFFPNAKVSADHFHISQEFNRKLDSIRISSMNHYYNRKKYLEDRQKELVKEGKKLEPQYLCELKEASKHYYVLKKFHWMLFSNSDKLFDDNQEKKYNMVLEGYYNYSDIFEYMVKQDRDLSIAYDLKYQLDEFYKNSSVDNAQERLSELISLFNQSTIKEMNDFGKTLTRWKSEIVVSFTRVDGKRVTNGIIENRNKVIKLIKHSANGYLNWERYRNRILYVLNKSSTYRMYPRYYKK